MDTTTKKDKLARFGRSLALLLNRSLMYQKNHPMVKSAIEDVNMVAQLLFQTISPVVFIVNRGRFYVDEEQLDPRINVKRIAHIFKTHGIQSVSFESGLTPGEIGIFVDIFSSMTATTNADTIKTDLLKKGAYNLRVNHVLYKKVTEDDQIVSREALKQVTPSMEDNDSESRKKFMDTVLETILTEEFANTLNIKSLLDNPAQVSKNMIEADLAGVDKFRTGSRIGRSGGGTGSGRAGTGAGTGGGSGIGPESAGIGAGTGDAAAFVSNTDIAAAAEADSHGNILLHQLDLMQTEVRKHLAKGGDISLEELADAVLEMKKQLFEDIQTQKALGIAYANEDSIVENINQLTDQVILKLIEEEYKNGNITTKRFAQIILRLIPDAKELKRLLPQIKNVLYECGMPLDAYLELVDELKHELQNEDLSRILEKSSEAIGIDSEQLMEELKGDPGQASKLIYLASEIRKGGGDESALADLLIDYVEQMTSRAAEESEGEGGKDHLKKVISKVESTVLSQLSKLDVGKDVLLRMEERVNERMDSILDKIRVEWLQSKAALAKKEKIKPLTVLQTLEHNVGDDEELGDILKEIRAMVGKSEIEENNFSQIHSEINRRKKQLQAKAEAKDIPEGVLSPDEFIFILEKEIARANRYNSTFSAMAFSVVNARPTMKALEPLVTTDTVMAVALDKLVNTIREVDYIGQIGKNKIVALLPMQSHSAGKLALARVMNLLNNQILRVNEIPVRLRVAGVVTEYDSEQTPDAHIFAKKLSNQLMDMVSRIKNIRVLF